MSREDIIRMAREADSGFEVSQCHEESIVGMSAIERFAALVASAEREACAQIADQMTQHSYLGKVGQAIRARKNND